MSIPGYRRSARGFRQTPAQVPGQAGPAIVRCGGAEGSVKPWALTRAAVSNPCSAIAAIVMGFLRGLTSRDGGRRRPSTGAVPRRITRTGGVVLPDIRTRAS